MSNGSKMKAWRIHPEGKPWVLGGALSAATLALLGQRRAAQGAALVGLAMAFFFRDPERQPPSLTEVAVSPADGEVVVVQEEDEPRWLEAPAWRIGIFMSVLDVHINRAPLDARVVALHHQPGEFLPAYHDEALQRNERCYYHLETPVGKVLLIQVAGILARRTVSFVQPGDEIQRGERLGLIRFGSRVELYLPRQAQPLVRPGHRVRAGETPIAWIE